MIIEPGRSIVAWYRTPRGVRGALLAVVLAGLAGCSSGTSDSAAPGQASAARDQPQAEAMLAAVTRARASNDVRVKSERTRLGGHSQ